MISLIRKYKIELLGVVSAVFLTHGLMLANDGFYWDDLYVFNLARKGWAYLYSNFYGHALPQGAYFHWVLYNISDSLFIYKLVTFLGFLLSAFSVLILVSLSRVFSRIEVLWITLLFATFSPVKSITATVSLFMYQVSLITFFLGTLVALNSDSSASFLNLKRWGRWIAHVIALMMFFFSFITASLLVFYFGFLAYWFYVSSRNRGRLALGSFFHFVRWRLDFIAIPFVFWIIKNSHYKPDSEHSYYNQFIWSPISVIQQFLSHAYYLISQGYDRAFLEGVSSFVACFCVMVGMSFLMKGILQSEASADEPEDRQSTIWIIAFGGVLLFLAILPYALVGKSPLAEEFATRHSLLTPLPMALLCVSLSRLIASKFTSKVRWVFLSILLAGFILLSVNDYLIAQARWTKICSITHHLSEIPDDKRSDNLIIRDEFQIGDDESGMIAWPEIVKSEWQGSDVDILTSDAAGNLDATEPLGEKQKNRMVLRISKGRYQGGARGAALKYIYMRLTFDDLRMARLLDNFVRVEYYPEGKAP